MLVITIITFVIIIIISLSSNYNLNYNNDNYFCNLDIIIAQLQKKSSWGQKAGSTQRMFKYWQKQRLTDTIFYKFLNAKFKNLTL